jgi:hypothetical protein
MVFTKGGTGMANKRASFISAVIVLAWASVAASPANWSTAGFTGVVDEEDRNIYQFNSAGSVSIKYSVPSGILDIQYQIQKLNGPQDPPPPEDCFRMIALVRDPGPGARVTLRLMRLGIGGGFGGRLTSLGGIDSDNPSHRKSHFDQPNEYATYSACINTPDEWTFDEIFHTFFVEAKLIKTTEGGNPGPGLKGIQLCSNGDACTL